MRALLERPASHLTIRIAPCRTAIDLITPRAGDGPADHLGWRGAFRSGTPDRALTASFGEATSTKPQDERAEEECRYL